MGRALQTGDCYYITCSLTASSPVGKLRHQGLAKSCQWHCGRAKACSQVCGYPVQGHVHEHAVCRLISQCSREPVLRSEELPSQAAMVASLVLAGGSKVLADTPEHKREVVS